MRSSCLEFNYGSGVAQIALLLAAFYVTTCPAQGLVFIDATDPRDAVLSNSAFDQVMPPIDVATSEPEFAEADSFANEWALAVIDGADEPLIERIVDPTAWLMEMRFRQQWTWPVENDPDVQVFQFRPTIPFVAWGQVNLLRVSVPYNFEGEDAPGLGDVQMFDLVVFKEDWGRWGIGPSVRLVPNADGGGSTFLAGPAGGAVSKTDGWTFGFLIQNFLSDGESQSRIQPILAYKLNDNWAVNIGESEFRYRWDESRWTQLPLGTQLNNISTLWGQKVQFFVNPQYNFVRDSNTSGWTIFVGLTLLVPEANR